MGTATNNHDPVFFRAREVSTILALSESRIRQLVRDGHLRSTRLGTRVLIPADEVTRFAAGLTAMATGNGQ